jgi:hypothetical protein
MKLRSVWIVLVVIGGVGFAAWLMSTQGPGGAISTPVPGGASDTRVPGLEPAVPPSPPQSTHATAPGQSVPSAMSPESAMPIGPVRLEESLPDSPGNGVLRQPEAISTETSSSGERQRLPETMPSPDDGRPLREFETTLPGLTQAADPAMLPRRPPEDQGETSTR